MWCKFGHVTVEISSQRKPRTPPCVAPWYEEARGISVGGNARGVLNRASGFELA